ncbi:MAG: DinB family protein [Anaerolineae bacterium]|nr:DinB family protein [Anaerolineae bacterium]
MPHPLVEQLRFTRSEFVRCLAGVSDVDAQRRIMPMNCLSWIIGHLAQQEQYYWVYAAQDKAPFPKLYEIVGYGQPATTPFLEEMWETWRVITAAADTFLDTLTPALMQTHFEHKGDPWRESIGTLLYRNIYHYWFHTGEAHAIRQQLGHTDLPEFVGPGLTDVSYQPDGI